MPHSKPSPQSQSDRFKEAARELEADHDGASDKLMGRMAKMKPEPHIKAEPKANEHAIRSWVKLASSPRGDAARKDYLSRLASMLAKC